VVHCHDVATLLPGAVGARLIRAPLVYDTHELASGVPYRSGGIKRIVNGLERVTIRHAALVIAASDGIADRLQARYSLVHRPLVLRNVCDLPRPAAKLQHSGKLRRLLGLEQEPLILHQGAAAPHRGCEMLIHAIPTLENVHLSFLGTPDPGFGAVLAALANRLRVAHRVHFVPSVSLDALLEHTCDADVGVMLFEPTCENYRLTLPNKVFEYIAAGVPLVATATPEVERILLEHRVGWTVDPTDLSSLVAGLKAALAERANETLRERVLQADQAFAWERERERLLHAYNALPTDDGRTYTHST